eukprot:XP_001689518.1 predicted protein [Chlamydomonas reinhardtii]
MLFIAFWAGMFIICGVAFSQGEPNRLVYGVDSWGMTCGTKNTLFNLTFDLTEARNLYYFNPTQLLSGVTGLLYAKTVCANSCPTGPSVCSATQLPCSSDSQFTCPYYRYAEDGLYGRIPGVGIADTTYWAALAQVTNITDPDIASVLSKLKSLGGVFAAQVTKLEANMSGEYYQLQSQIPGNGPCYPNLFETVEYFNRCFPKFPSNLTAALVSTASGVAKQLSNNSLVQDFANNWDSSSQKWGRYVGDISKGILVIVVGGLLGGLVLSLIWLVVLRFLGGFMVWIAIVFVNLCAIAACLFTWVKAGYIGDQQVAKTILDAIPVEINPAQSEEKTWFWIAIGTSIFAGVTLLVTLLCISRIKIAVACVKVASQAVGSMPTIIFFPLLPFIFEVGLVIYWVAVTALLYSAGDLTAHCRSAEAGASASLNFKQYANVSNIKSTYDSVTNFDLNTAVSNAVNNSINGFLNGTAAASLNGTRDVCYANVSSDARSVLCGRDPDCYLSYDWNNNLKYAFIYHFFGLLWTNQVIIGFTYVTIAGAIAHFYWSRGDSANMPTFPILTSLKNTVVYHMGSICFGALIIAIIQFIRALLEYLDRKTKELQAQNKFAEWAMCIVKCCMKCLEWIVRFINRNAYIMIAIKGKGYCCAAMDAIALIVSNIGRIAVVNMVAAVLIFLGKVSVASAAGVIAYAMTEAKYYNSQEEYPETYLYSPVLVIAISVISAYAIAEIFFAVYEMAIDTIILAFCEDCSNGGPKFAPPLLMEVMGKTALPEAAAKAEKA